MDSLFLTHGSPSNKDSVLAEAEGAYANTAADSRSRNGFDLEEVDQEIARLEKQLQAAHKRRRNLLPFGAAAISELQDGHNQQQHFLLLLSDSALPLGSFAFSSGLESFLAHSKASAAEAALMGTDMVSEAPTRAIGSGDEFSSSFLPLSVSSYARASLPFVLAGHDAAALSASRSQSPSAASASLASQLAHLDDTYDATLICTVGRRASVAQGRALLSVWERAYAPAFAAAAPRQTHSAPGDPLQPFSRLVKKSSALASAAVATSAAGGAADLSLLPAVSASAHLPPLFGAVAALAGLDRRQTADVFLLAHIKALASAAVRASLIGPYQAQRLLASDAVRHMAATAVDRAWAVSPDEAGQTAPVMDLWMGRHEMLYSRIFNS